MKKLLVSPIPLNKATVQQVQEKDVKSPWMQGKHSKQTSPTTVKPPHSPDMKEIPVSIFDPDVEFTPVKAVEFRDADISAIIKSSKVNQAKKAMTFQPYKSTRPDLLQHLNHIIEQGMKTISVGSSEENKESDEAEKMYLIYSTAFQVFIDESTLYQPFLISVKNAYENYASSLLKDVKDAAEKLGILSVHEEIFGKQKKDLEEKHAQQLKLLQENTKDFQKRALVAEEEKNRVEMEFNCHKEGTVNMRKEYEDLKNTCNLLTSSLSRMEDEYRNYQTQESSKATELTNLRASEQTLNAEVERLQQVIQAQEQTISLMISPEHITSLNSTIQTLQEELAHIEQTHKQLLLRYATLKHLVEDTIMKFAHQSGNSHENKTLSAFLQQVQEQTQKHFKNKSNQTSGQAKLGLSTANHDNLHITLEKLLIQKENVSLVKQHFFEVMLDRLTSFYAQTHNVNTNSANHSGHSGINEIDSDLHFSSPYAHFQGQGYAVTVPSYLQYNGKVQNLSLQKTEVITLCNELIDAKKAFEQMYGQPGMRPATQAGEGGEGKGEGADGGEGPRPPSLPPSRQTNVRRRVSSRGGQSAGGGAGAGPGSGGGAGAGAGGMISQNLLETLPLGSISFPVFIEYYLKDKFNGNEMLATEIYYNLLEGVRAHQGHSSDIKLFSILFEEKLPFEIAYDLQDNVVSLVYDECMKEAKLLLASQMTSTGGESSMSLYRLTVEQVMRVVRRLFVNKSESSFHKLSKALALDYQSHRVLAINELLFEDATGHRSLFLETLKLQHLLESLSFDKHVYDTFASQLEGESSAERERVTISRLREVLGSIDKEKSRVELNNLLCMGCQLSVEEMLLAEAKKTTVSTRDFKMNLKKVLLKKSTGGK